ncbi:MAG: hypothetical protein P0Y66_14085 [Candidatus Kaistia colombiensis]|nr:MAG: hypothetical protein P0Y66_14085 [Kaistia sp.]
MRISRSARTWRCRPGKVILQNDCLPADPVQAGDQEVLKRPLLIVPPWINKFYILDLNPEKILHPLGGGAGPHGLRASPGSIPTSDRPRRASRTTCAKASSNRSTGPEDHRREEVNAIGYCVGGTLLSYTLAYMAGVGDTRIASATLFATQVDFTHAGDLKVFIDEEQIEAVEKKMSVRGYLEGKNMTASFNMLRSNDLIWSYVVNNYFRGREPIPFDLLYWNSDATRMPAANHSFYLRNCYLDNKLAEGELSVDGKPLSLGDVTIPIYNLATRDDHIAPPRSVFFGSSFFGGPVDLRAGRLRPHRRRDQPALARQVPVLDRPAPHGDGLDWMARQPRSIPAPGGRIGRPGSRRRTTRAPRRARPAAARSRRSRMRRAAM